MDGLNRILICDGNVIRARSIAQDFSNTSSHWIVGVVHSGEDGLNILKEIPQNCILLQETGLQDMKGVELLRRIRRVDGEVPILFLSKMAQSEQDLKDIPLGVFEYLNEPYSISDIKRLVTRTLEKEVSPPPIIKEEEGIISSQSMDTPEEKEDSLPVIQKFEEILDGEMERGTHEIPLPSSLESDLLTKCLSLSMNLLKATRGVVFLYEKKVNRLIVRESRGFNGHFPKNSSIDIHRIQDIEILVTEGKPCFLSIEESLLACAPLGSPPQVLGVIGLGRQETFTTADMKALSVFSPLAPYALEGSRVQTELERVRAGSIHSLLVLLEMKDPERRKHADRVMKLSMSLAKTIGLPEKNIHSLKYASLLHEMGILAEGQIETKEEEKRKSEIRSLTEKIIKPLRIEEEVKQILRHEGERFDGEGEPDGLLGEEIPVGSRILSIMDAFDETLSEGLPEEVAVENLTQNSGTLFDPLLVDTFLSERFQLKRGKPQNEFEGDPFYTVTLQEILAPQ